MKVKRRAVMLGAGAAAVAVSVPLVSNGISGFLWRTLRDHFGADVVNIEGLEAFVADYAAIVGEDDFAKRSAAQVYFGLRGEQIKEVSMAREFSQRFLQTILTRSNIIAVRQGQAEAFEYSDADPWAAVCGTYLTALAEPIG